MWKDQPSEWSGSSYQWSDSSRIWTVRPTIVILRGREENGPERQTLLERSKIGQKNDSWLADRGMIIVETPIEPVSSLIYRKPVTDMQNIHRILCFNLNILKWLNPHHDDVPVHTIRSKGMTEVASNIIFDTLCKDYQPCIKKPSQ